MNGRPVRGFVLPVTVAMLALVAVGVALVAQRSDQLRTLVLGAQAEERAAREVERAAAEVKYLSTIIHRRAGRMGEIELDGRWYRNGDGVLVGWRDAASRFNLRRAPRAELQRLFAAVGIEPVAADRLADAMQDYTDADSLVSLNGAEAPEYRGSGLPPPRNGRLLIPQELDRLLGWAQVPPEQRRALLGEVWVGSSRAINLHTVTAPVLAASADIAPALAADLIAQRPPGTPLRLESLPNFEGGSFLALARYRTLPSETLLVTLCPRGVAWCRSLSITTTADSPYAPWHIDHSLRLPAPALPAKLESLPPLPERAPERAPPPLWSPFTVPGAGPS